jgi:hypothetical protein
MEVRHPELPTRLWYLKSRDFKTFKLLQRNVDCCEVSGIEFSLLHSPHCSVIVRLREICTIHESISAVPSAENCQWFQSNCSILSIQVICRLAVPHAPSPWIVQNWNLTYRNLGCLLVNRKRLQIYVTFIIRQSISDSRCHHGLNAVCGVLWLTFSCVCLYSN